jgi:NAD(P)-dependent dehydrogenase (short-subunit alcohol dehydrogenase family)
LLQRKVGLVTGGSSRIGRAIALAWARDGARVIVSDTNTAAGHETVELIRTRGREAVFLAGDVSNPWDSQTLVEQTIAHFGRLDIACNTAGVEGPATALHKAPSAGVANAINVNLSAVFFGMRHQIAAMLKTGSGSIINMASAFGAAGFPAHSARAVNKHGVIGLTQVAAKEYGVYGIRINAIGVGAIHAPLVNRRDNEVELLAMLAESPAIGRLGRAEEVAELAAWLASDHASFITGAYYPIETGCLTE